MLAPVAEMYSFLQGLQSLSTGQVRSYRLQRREFVDTKALFSCAGLFWRILVDELFEFFAGFEIRNTLGGNADRLAGLRVPSTARATLAHPKAAKAAQLDLLALIQALDDAFENKFNQSLGIFLGQLSGVSHIIDQISFSHAVTSLRERPFVRSGQLILQEHSAAKIRAR